MSFKTYVSLLIFWLNDVSIDESGTLKSPTIILLLSIFCFMAVMICLMNWGASLLGTYIFAIVISPSWIDPFLDHYVMSFFVSYNSLYFKVCFVSYEYNYSSFLLISICIEYLLPSPHFQSVCVPRSEMGLL